MGAGRAAQKKMCLELSIPGGAAVGRNGVVKVFDPLLDLVNRSVVLVVLLLYALPAVVECIKLVAQDAHDSPGKFSALKYSTLK